MRSFRFAKLVPAVLVAAMVAGPVAAVPLTVATPLLVSATVLSTCVIVPGAIAFADYQTGEQANVSANIAVTCTPDVSGYQVALDAGTGSGAAVATGRKMTFAGNTLTYNLYRNSARTQPWGFTRDVDTVVSTGTGAQSYMVYAKLVKDQYVPIGLYQDTVNVSLLY